MATTQNIDARKRVNYFLKASYLSLIIFELMVCKHNHFHLAQFFTI